MPLPLVFLQCRRLKTTVLHHLSVIGIVYYSNAHSINTNKKIYRLKTGMYFNLLYLFFFLYIYKTGKFVPFVLFLKKKRYDTYISIFFPPETIENYYFSSPPVVVSVSRHLSVVGRIYCPITHLINSNKKSHFKIGTYFNLNSRFMFRSVHSGSIFSPLALVI